MNQIVVNPLDRSHHDGEGGFREQICALYYTGLWSDSAGNTWAKFIKTRSSKQRHIKWSLAYVCQPGAASMDPNNPGVDSNASWRVMDELIENENVRGFYHTHPPGVSLFSAQDGRLQEGFARANGITPIWHVVQAANSPQAHAICVNMINGQVFLYKLGDFDHEPSDPIILLPLPPKIGAVGKMHVIDLS